MKVKKTNKDDKSMEELRILSPKNDFLFKKLFFDKDNQDLLKKLLEDCIGFDKKQVSEITLIDRALQGETQEEKEIVLDVMVKLSDETQVNVEIQLVNQRDYRERTIFYLSRMLSSQKIKGYGYSELKQTVALNIVDFDIFTDTEEFYSSFTFREVNRGTELSDIMKVEFLELKKYNESLLQSKNKKALWQKFFNIKGKEDIEMLKELDENFKKPLEKLEYLSKDPAVLTDYEKSERKRRDEEARMQYAISEGFKEGRERGIEQGIEQGILATAKNMLEDGVDIALISKYTGLDTEIIEKLKY